MLGMPELLLGLNTKAGVKGEKINGRFQGIQVEEFMGIKSIGEIKSKEAEEIKENPTWKGKTWEMKRPGR